MLFIFRFGWGVAGSGWATTVAQVLALVLGVALMLSRRLSPADTSFISRGGRAWRALWQQFRLGFPMGLL